MEFVIFAFGCAVGVAIGYIIAYSIINHRFTVGALRVDRSIPDEEPMIFLEIYRGVGDITQHKRVTLVVKNESYLSQD